jgi:PAS domain-containing protein
MIVLSQLKVIPSGLWVIGVVGCMLGSIVLFLFYYNEIYLKTDELVSTIERIRGRESMGSLSGGTDIEKILNHINQQVDLVDQSTSHLNNIYKPIETSDFIGVEKHSLVETIRNLKRTLRSEKAALEQRKWFDDGIRVMAEASQENRDNLRTFSQHFLTVLLDHVEFPVGAVYLFNDFDPDAPLKIYGTYGFAQTELHDSLNIEDTLVGRAIREKKPIYLNQIPENYQQIQSGLGEAKANNVLIIPLIANQVAVGALELAAFRAMDPRVIKFCEQISTLFAVNLNNIHLSEFSIRRYNEVLDKNRNIQSEALDTEKNLSDLQQELSTLAQERDALESRLVKYQQKVELFDQLLNHTPQRILFKDEESHVIDASEVLVKHSSIKTREDIQGASDLDIYDPESVKTLLHDERRILQGGKPIINTIERLTLRNSKVIKVLSHTFGMQDENDELFGTIVVQNEVPDFLTNLLETEIDGALFFDGKGSLTSTNLSPKIKLRPGKYFSEIFDQALVEELKQHPVKLIKDTMYSETTYIYRSDNGTVVCFLKK